MMSEDPLSPDQNRPEQISREPVDSIADDEVLYRRVPLAHFPTGRIAAEHFKPHKTRDQDGLSLTRAKWESAEQLLSRTDKPGSGVFAVTARELRAIDLTIVPSPRPDEPGHCHIPEFCSSRRDEDFVLLRRHLLVELFTRNRVL